ncbi:UNVERIFIED_ORG: hypothetical protein BDK47_11618 [Anoxybacillus amylolyticus]
MTWLTQRKRITISLLGALFLLSACGAFFSEDKETSSYQTSSLLVTQEHLRDSFVKKHPRTQVFVEKKNNKVQTLAIRDTQGKMHYFQPIPFQKESSPSVLHTVLNVERHKEVVVMTIEVEGTHLPTGIPFLASNIEHHNHSSIAMLFYDETSSSLQPAWAWFDGQLFKRTSS